MPKRKITGDSKFAEAVGDRVQKLRLDRRLSQAALATAVGVEPHTLSRWERGVRPIPLVMLPVVAHALGTRVTDLVDVDVSEVPKLSNGDAIVLAKWNALDEQHKALVAGVLDLGAVPRSRPKGNALQKSKLSAKARRKK